MDRINMEISTEAPLIWQAQYSVGLEELDAQHRYFVTLLERVEALAKTKQTHLFPPLLEELLRYARYHFATEEALMAAYAYDGAVHRMKHGKMLTRIEAMLSEENFRPAALRIFVYNWLVDHIQLEDLLLANHVRARRAASHGVPTESPDLDAPSM
jgi:hemerythrin